MLLNGGVDQVLVGDAVSDETVDFMINLGEQRRHLRRILIIAFRHRRRDNLTLG